MTRRASRLETDHPSSAKPQPSGDGVTMKNVTLKMVCRSANAFTQLLQDAGCDVAPITDDTWRTDAVSWHLFLCHLGGAVVLVNVAIDLQGDDGAMICVTAEARRFLYFWRRRRDVRLVGTLTDMLISKGATLLIRDNTVISKASTPQGDAVD